VLLLQFVGEGCQKVSGGGLGGYGERLEVRVNALCWAVSVSVTVFSLDISSVKKGSLL